MDQFKFYNHLGFNNPYYILRDSSFRVCNSFKEAVDNYDNKKEIDYVSIVGLLNNSFIFGDRTMIQGIQRTPWLAQPDPTNSNWQFTAPPSHFKKEMLEEDIAIVLFQRLCDEIEEYIDKKRNVGILLSGGMDSRMLAGAVDFMIKTKRIQDIEVTGLTWGNEDSRDVVYAKEIASRLGWNWKHYSVNAKQLMNNIYETADHGCEYSPVHLHGIPQIRDDNRLNVILAASYGDSVGRAEYSGRKVTKLSSINHSIKNISGLIDKNVFRSALTHINEDIRFYHNLFPVKENYMRNELDYELHYMRRMLNPCMELLINNGTKFYQVFTHPKVYGFMWSIDPKKRNDMVYKYMMNEFKTNLSDIPWSRTGLPYGTNVSSG
jgi:asparagine synthase (glutamine-hydrolysing)